MTAIRQSKTMLAKDPAERNNMFSIKKVKDTIVSKSVLPTSKPVLNIGKANETIQALKAQLSASIVPSVIQSQPSVVDATSRKELLAEMKPYQDKLTLADYGESPEVIRAKMALLQAQEDYTVLQTKSKNAIAQAEIEKQIYANINRTSTSEVFYIPSAGYYITYDTYGNISKVFIRKDSEPASVMFNILVHRRPSDTSKGSPDVVIQSSIEALVDLTKQEFQAILTGKPAYADLCKVYRLAFNQNVTINIDKVSPVY
jgi:hypothetical protein